MLEPTGERRAIDDAPIGAHFLVHKTTQAAIISSLLGLVFTAVLGWEWIRGAGWLTVLALALVTLYVVFGSLVTFGAAHQSRKRIRLLGAQFWRAGTVRVFAAAGHRGVRLLVDEHTEHPLRLSVLVCDWTDKQILARTGRLWLLGPTADGGYLLRLPGQHLLDAKETAENIAGETEVTVEQFAPTRLPRAAEDVIAAKAADSACSQHRSSLLVTTVLIALTLTGLGDALLAGSTPRQVVGAAALVLVMASAATAIRSDVWGWLFWRRVRRLLNAGPWTFVRVTMPSPVKAFAVTHGHATLSDGRTIPLRLRASYWLAANVAATGLIWVAGEPAPGRETAVGLPGYSYLGYARFGPTTTGVS